MSDNEHGKRQDVQGARQDAQGVRQEEQEGRILAEETRNDLIEKKQGEAAEEQKKETRRVKIVRRVFIAWIIVFSLAVMYSISENRSRTTEGIKAKNALCEIRSDRVHQVRNTKEFLDSHPGPTLLGGVPRATLVKSMNDAKQTIENLKPLNCPPEKVK
jgi:hypothetical protein